MASGKSAPLSPLGPPTGPTIAKGTFAASFLGSMVVILVLFSGCKVVGPDFQQPEPQMLSQAYQAKDFQHQPSVELDSWWESFADPTLDQLVSQALVNNLTVQVAAERIIEARANVSLNGGNLLPNVDANNSYEYLKRSPNARPFVGSNGDPFQLFTSGLDSIWEIDLFGRLERAIQAAEAELVSQEYSLQDVQQTLVADVATSYLNIRLLQNQVQTVEQSLQLQAETSTLVGDRADAGVSTKLDAEQTTAFLHRTRAAKAALELQLNCEFNRLSILLGESPAAPLRGFVGYGVIPDSPYVPEAGIPADLIRRRPDIRQAEAVVAAATARIGVAEADLYPTLQLLGSISLSAQDVSSLFETDSLAFSVGPAFNWNILHFGRINDNIEIHESQMRQAVGTYRATVLEAVKEVEDAMAMYDGLRKQLEALESALESDANATVLSLERYKVGKANFQRVIDTQLQMLQDSRAAATARASANIQLIRLYRAVGGGWPGQRSAANAISNCNCDQNTTTHAQCLGGCLADSQPIQQGVGIVQNQVGTPIQFQPVTNAGVANSGVATANTGLDESQSIRNQLQKAEDGTDTILNVEPLGNSVAPVNPVPQRNIQSDTSDDYSPLQFTPDVSQSNPANRPGFRNMSAELFDWGGNSDVVVKSQAPVKKVASVGYFVESPKENNK